MQFRKFYKYNKYLNSLKVSTTFLPFGQIPQILHIWKIFDFFQYGPHSYRFSKSHKFSTYDKYSQNPLTILLKFKAISFSSINHILTGCPNPTNSPYMTNIRFFFSINHILTGCQNSTNSPHMTNIPRTHWPFFWSLMPYCPNPTNSTHMTNMWIFTFLLVVQIPQILHINEDVWSFRYLPHPPLFSHIAQKSFYLPRRSTVIELVPSVRVSVCVSYHSYGSTDWDIGLKFYDIVWCNIIHPICFHVHVCVCVSIHHGKRTFG